jgi:hypothetical protein
MNGNLTKDQLRELLDTSLEERDLKKTMTVRQYLLKLLSTLWLEDECFNGKRPFGNSGWQDQINQIIEDKGLYKPCGDYWTDKGAFKNIMIEAIQIL